MEKLWATDLGEEHAIGPAKHYYPRPSLEWTVSSHGESPLYPPWRGHVTRGCQSLPPLSLLSLCLSVSLCPSLSPSVSVCLCLSVSLSLFPLFTSLSQSLSLCLSVCLSVCLSLSLSLCLSLSVSTASGSTRADNANARVLSGWGRGG